MTVGAVSSGNDLYTGGVQNRGRQKAADLDALATALGTGDLEGAKKAFSQVQQDFQSASARRSFAASTGSAASATSAVGTLAQSLTSGDLAGAQKAYATLQQSLQDLGLRGHRGHGRQLASLLAADPSGTSQTSTDFKSLLTSLGNGDLTAAQTAFNSLVADLQKAQSGQTQSQTQSVRSAAKADFSALGASLQSGDLAAAKEAYAKLQQELQLLRQQQGVYAPGGAHQAAASVSGAMVDATA